MNTLKLSTSVFRHLEQQRPARLSPRTKKRGLVVAAKAAATHQYNRVRLQTRQDCELAVSFYPRFQYNALGGGGWGTVTDLG